MKAPEGNGPLKVLAGAVVVAAIFVALGTGAYFGALSVAQISAHIAPAPISSSSNATALRDLAAQEAMADWAFWLLLVTCAGLVVTIVGTVAVLRQIGLTARALDVAQDANKINREMGEAQTRCYIEVDEATITFDQRGLPDITVRARNSGQSPAKQLTIYCGARVNCQQGDWSWQGKRSITEITNFLASGETKTFNLKFIDEPPISQGDLSDLIDTAHLEVRLMVQACWKDVFDLYHEETWLFSRIGGVELTQKFYVHRGN